MNLKTYLKEHETAVSLSRRIGAQVPDMSSWANGKRPVPPWFAREIETATNGLVTRAEMETIHKLRIWPELTAQPTPTKEAA